MKGNMSTQPKNETNPVPSDKSRRSDLVYVATMAVVGLLVCICGLMLASDGKLPGLDSAHDKVTGGFYSGVWD